MSAGVIYVGIAYSTFQFALPCNFCTNRAGRLRPAYKPYYECQLFSSFSCHELLKDSAAFKLHSLTMSPAWCVGYVHCLVYHGGTLVSFFRFNSGRRYSLWSETWIIVKYSPEQILSFTFNVLSLCWSCLQGALILLDVVSAPLIVFLRLSQVRRGPLGTDFLVATECACRIGCGLKNSGLNSANFKNLAGMNPFVSRCLRNLQTKGAHVWHPQPNTHLYSQQSSGSAPDSAFVISTQ